jgi:hypothetical protein
MDRIASGHYATTATGGRNGACIRTVPAAAGSSLDPSGNRQNLLERATLPLGRRNLVRIPPPDPRLVPNA